MEKLIEWLSSITGIAVIAASAITLAILIHIVVFAILKNLAKRSDTVIDDLLLKHTKRSTMVFMLTLFAFIAFQASNSLIDIADKKVQLFRHGVGILLIISVTWFLINLTSAFESFITKKFSIDKADNLKARKVQTQIKMIKRIMVIIILVVGISAGLMTFEKVRQLGTSILASAGIVGIIIGFAAQKSLSTFIAGLQIAITQPIRIDDVVIVEGEWGRIEEITLTYVVIRIWDLRRLIVPINYFIEKPFQNWTRVSADILGSVFIYTDYTVPTEALREKLKTALDTSELWDKKVCVLQVTNATERTVELRALMSATDASKAWDLRCQIREQLIDFIRENYPHALPKTRVEMDQKEPHNTPDITNEKQISNNNERSTK